ncbi:Synaptotagmin-4-like protein [Dinothrombium tinctorium]|uniref:Synaptotagmin-4-like protein n=1 Tax=Dinothrombium tinctorium TaxID=1965070 RepID=A0A443RPK0_9ACAR|nr:Synaptotagmin-4-like protein [Dinothrombium tinctorium]
MKLQSSYLKSQNHKYPVDVDKGSNAVIAVSIGTAFLVVIGAAITCYLYRKRSSNKTLHTTLLLKKTYIGERPISLRRPTAVKSPGSSAGSGPTLKKSPSPTGQKTPPGNSEPPIERRPTNGSETKACSQNERKEAEQKELVERHSDKAKSDEECDKLSPIEKEKRLHEEKPQTLGKLHFKLKYNYEKHALCVTVVKCEDLPSPRDANLSNSDPYVKLQLLPDKQHKAKTRVLRKTFNPVYDEDFTFYGINPNQLETTALHFVVLNFDRYSRDDIIGEVIYQLGHLQFDSLEKQISLVQDIAPRSLRSQGRGEILVSLCYQPAANRLTVVVLKARNLPKMDLTGLCDPYVKIYLMYNNQRIAKKKTHVKKRTTNPVFNESFIFDVPYNEGLDNLSLEFLLLDYDRVTKNEVIGKLEIGPKATGTALKHWKDVASSPRRQIAEWHKL